MTTTEMQRGRFDIGRVIGRTFNAISRNWLVFLVASVILVGIPSAIQTLGGPEQALISRSPQQWLFWWIGLVLTVVGTYVLQGAIVVTTVKDLNGKKLDVADAMATGLQFFFPLFGLAILMGLGVGLGLILLVVPGIILSVMWVVTAPALVIEKRGVMDSFGRSRDLTRGNRWMIFFLVLIYWIASSLIGFAVTGMGAALAGGVAPDSPASPLLVIGSSLAAVVSAVISSSGIAAIYYELRNIKEGVAPEQLASVFD